MSDSVEGGQQDAAPRAAWVDEAEATSLFSAIFQGLVMIAAFVAGSVLTIRVVDALLDAVHR